MNLTVKNGNGEQFGIIAVRYFKFNGSDYLIFTKNEIDESGYQKLYICKVNNMVGSNIDDVEWNLVRDTIKLIAKANKDNTALPVQDLNEAEINGIQIVEEKPFKLATASVTLLGANKNVQAVAPATQTVPVEQNAVNPLGPVPPVQEPANVNPVPMNPNPVSLNTNPVLENVQPVSDMNNSIPQQVNEPVVNNNIIPDVLQNSVIPNTNVNVENNLSNSIPESVVTPIAPANMDIPAVNQPVNNLVSNPMDNIIPTQSPIVDQTISNNVPQNNVMPSPVPAPGLAPADTVDYKKLYEEQTLKLNTLTTELEQYKSLVQQLKSILN